MKHCPNCGVEIEEGQRFCGECGAQLFDELPREPVYTENERLKNDPVLNAAAAKPAPKQEKKQQKVPELTLEPDVWGTGAAAAVAAAAPEPEKKEQKVPELTLEPDVWKKKAAAQAAEAAPPAEKETAAAQAIQAVEQQAEPGIANPTAERDYEQADAEYHGPAQGSQGDFRAKPQQDLPNDYTMSKNAVKNVQKLPNETLMLVWSIILTCMFNVFGVVGLVKTIKARKTTSFAQKSKLLNSAKVWLIIGTVLRILAFIGLR